MAYNLPTNEIKLEPTKVEWPLVMSRLQGLPPEAQVRLVFERDKDRYFVVLRPSDVTGFHFAERHPPGTGQRNAHRRELG
jgi:hypothetical protein